MRLNETAYHFHSSDSLLLCFCQLSVVQLHTSLTATGHKSIKFHQHGIYCVNSEKWTFTSLVFPIRDFKSFFLLKTFLSPKNMFYVIATVTNLQERIFRCRTTADVNLCFKLAFTFVWGELEITNNIGLSFYHIIILFINTEKVRQSHAKAERKWS